MEEGADRDGPPLFVVPFTWIAVHNQLQAIESPQGHGDSFWSVCLALPEREVPQEAFVVVG